MYVHSITSIPTKDTRRQKFFRYSKGYHNWYVDNYTSYPCVLDYIKENKTQKLSSLEQRIMHKHYYAEQINSMFNDFGHIFNIRIKLYMLIHNITKPNICTECSNYVKPRKSTSGFRITCSDTCEIERTNSKRKSKFKLFTGEFITIMGYEGYVYNKLIELTSFDNIVYGSKRIREHTTMFNYTINSINRKYYPDFYLVKQRKIIEVKSSYTYKADFDKNIAKAKACVDNEYSFEFWIHDLKVIYKMNKDYTLTIINYTNYNIND